MGGIKRFDRIRPKLRLRLAKRGALIVMVTVCVAWPGAIAQTPAEMTAVSLFNFAKFVEWPPEVLPGADTPIVIGVICEDAIVSEIESTVRNKTANGRRIVVQRFRKASDFFYCHILFVGASESNELAKLLAGIKNTSVLTVSETEGFTRSGGIVNIAIRDNRLQFEINQTAAERAGLKISSKLLRVARVVRD